jgi:hypothetical protein
LLRPASTGKRILINVNCFWFGREWLHHIGRPTEVTEASGRSVELLAPTKTSTLDQALKNRKERGIGDGCALTAANQGLTLSTQRRDAEGHGDAVITE